MPELVGDTMIDMVVVNYHTYDLLDRFVSSYEQYQPSCNSNLIIIDNDSVSNEIHYKYLSHDVWASPENLGYGGGCNLGASLGDAPYIGLFNSDVEFVNNTCVDICVQYLEDNPSVGICGPFQFTDRFGRKEITSAGIFGTNQTPKHRAWRELDRGKYRDNEPCLMVMGSAMFIRRTAWDAIRLDPLFMTLYPDSLGAMPNYPLYYEDTFLCYLMPHYGYEVHYVGQAELKHGWHETIDRHGDSGYLTTSQTLFRHDLDLYGIAHD